MCVPKVIIKYISSINSSSGEFKKNREKEFSKAWDQRPLRPSYFSDDPADKFCGSCFE